MLWHCVAVLVALSLDFVVGQSCSPANTNSNCEISGYPYFGSTVYYAPDDDSEVSDYVVSGGSCTTGSQGYGTFNSGTYYAGDGVFLGNCDCFALDGQFHAMDCPGILRNSLSDGPYYFVFNLGSGGIFLNQFTVTHEQATVTAATPTSTTTDYITATQTITTTSTVMTTSTDPQSTVTTWATTDYSTTTITPPSATSTITSTTTVTVTTWTSSVTGAARTVTTLCTNTQTSTSISASPGRFMPRNALERRDGAAYNDGDGPLTTTVTPPAVTVTATGNGGTVTSTVTQTVISTAHVAAQPPTTTIYSGTAQGSTATTLPQKTVTTIGFVSTTTLTRTSTRVVTWSNLRQPYTKCTNQ